MAMSEEFEADMADPILHRDIELAKEKIDFLSANKEKCFLCLWVLEDYQKNGTLTGVKRDGGLGKFEIFPIRGEINHIWLEVYRKPYPFKKKVSKYEETVTKPPPFQNSPLAPEAGFVPQVEAPLSRPGPQPAPTVEITKGIDDVPLAKPKR